MNLNNLKFRMTSSEIWEIYESQIKKIKIKKIGENVSSEHSS